MKEQDPGVMRERAKNGVGPWNFKSNHEDCTQQQLTHSTPVLLWREQRETPLLGGAALTPLLMADSQVVNDTQNQSLAIPIQL